MTAQQIQALRAIAGMFVDAVREAGTMGAPGGVMYAAVMSKLSLSQFEQIMSGLIRAGKLDKRGERYFIAGV